MLSLDPPPRSPSGKSAGLSLSLHCPQNPGRRGCHRSDWLPAHCCFLTCLSLPDQPLSGLELLQHKQAHWFPHTQLPQVRSNWPFLPTPLLCFPPPLPSSFPRPAGLSKWEEGSRRYARSWQAERFPLGGNVAFFTFNPERNMVLRKLVFSTESSQRKKKEKEGPAAPHSGLTTHPCPIRRLILGGNCPGQSAELQRLSWHTVRDSHSHV